MERAPGLGYIPDPPDPRDYRLKDAPPGALSLSAAPDRYDALSVHVRGLLYQDGSEGCTGFSSAQAFRTRSSFLGRPAMLPSALLLWYMGRKTHGSENRNGGTYLRSVLHEAHDMGLVAESSWPSNNAAFDFAKDPAEDPRVFRRAYDARAFGYYRIDGIARFRVDEVKKAISSGCPVLFGTDVDADFIRSRKHSAVPIPSGETKGGHAMCAVAYDEFGIKGPNSWGPNWGNDGWFYLSWEYVTWYRTRDLWAISDPKELVK